MVIWLIGKSAAGKTTIGKPLYRKIRATYPNTVFLDGDMLREAVGEELGFSIEDRFISEKRTSRLCKLLSDQEINVICAKLSNAPEIRAWNKENIHEYYEIYVRAKQDILEERDPKGIYQQFNDRKIDSVVGLDIPFHEPVSPWLVIDNDGTQTAEQLAEYIFNKLNLQSVKN